MKEKIISLLKKETKLLEKEIENLIEIPPSKELGDYSFPCFILSKKFKQPPQKIAEDLAKKIRDDSFEKIESKGPYINFFINRKEIAKTILEQVQKKDFGKKNLKQKVILEFPSPNTNKPLHIGHARNIVFGQSIAELIKFCGANVKILNLNNDRGIHICKSMVALEKFGKNDSPEKAKKKSDHFVGGYYVKFADESKKNPELENLAKECLIKWEAKDSATIKQWKKMNSWALKGFRETYKKFNLSFDKEYFESGIYDKGKEIILDVKNKKFIKQKPDGAYYINLEEEGLGEKILLRADKTSIYITQDIYLALLKNKDFKPDKSVYITATEQIYHFKVLFALLEKLGYAKQSNLEHLYYGMVNLESGRMKSREGTVVDVDDLISELETIAEKELQKRDSKLKKEEKKKRAEAIAMAALRYYFLKIERTKDMIFKPEESINFEGNTGPYLLYTYARAKSILRKSKKSHSKKISPREIEDKEKNLLFQLGQFPEVVDKAFDALAPNLIANYAYHLAQTFNEFYHSTKVLGSEQEQFRLVLVDSFSKVLKISLSLLGIQTLEKM